MRTYEISVIIPVYNTQPYLKRCIESILSQTHQDFEIILIDDGSTDKSAGICDEYATQYENISVIHNDNQGPAASREEGVKRAGGSLIMFVDSDDWLHEKILEKLYIGMMEANADIVCCTHQDIYKNKKREYPCDIKDDYLDCVTSIEIMEQIHKTRNVPTGPVAKLYKKALFEQVDFRNDVTIGEDYSMLIQLAENAKKIRILKEVLYYRQMRGDNLSHSGYTKRHEGALYNYMQIRNKLIEKYPELSKDITGYHIEYEMAVITAMCRSNVYDRKIIFQLRKDLKEHLRIVLANVKITSYIKISAVMIVYIPHLFIILFRLLHKVTGR